MKIIAFGHRKGVGKSTASKFLTTHLRCEYPDLKIKEVSFAAKLKDISWQLFSWAGLKRGVYYETHYQEKEFLLPRLNLSPRNIWIGVGNKLREIYSNTWIDYALNVNADIIIISDLRFINEAVAINSVGGTLVKINRDVPKGTDPAEVDLANWNIWNTIIDNNGTLNKLNDTLLYFFLNKGIL